MALLAAAQHHHGRLRSVLAALPRHTGLFAEPLRDPAEPLRDPAEPLRDPAEPPAHHHRPAGSTPPEDRRSR